MRRATGGADVEVIPEPTSILVTSPADVDRLVRAARASIGQLRLALRVATNDADRADSSHGVIAAAAADALTARKLLCATLDQQLANRRREMAVEVDGARAAAAAAVANAREKAAALAAAARDQMMQVLLDGADEEPTATVPLHIVPDPVVATEPPSLAYASPPDPADDGVDVLVAAAASPGPGVTPVAPQTVEPLTGPATAPFGVPEPVAVHEPAAPPAPVPAAAPPAEPSVPTSARGASYVRRFLYLDVVLPLIAVLIIVMVLLAWVG